MKYWHDGMNILMTFSTKIITRKMPAAEDGNTRSVEGPIAEEVNPPPPSSKNWRKLLRGSKIIRHRQQRE